MATATFTQAGINLVACSIRCLNSLTACASFAEKLTARSNQDQLDQPHGFLEYLALPNPACPDKNPGDLPYLKNLTILE
jgi:hypothetical protein